MASVSSALALAYEAKGYSIGSPPLQMEAGGTVAQSVQSVWEAPQSFTPAFHMNYESSSSLMSTAVVSNQEILCTVRAVF
jgi:hypothetical protein